MLWMRGRVGTRVRLKWLGGEFAASPHSEDTEVGARWGVENEVTYRCILVGRGIS